MSEDSAATAEGALEEATASPQHSGVARATPEVKIPTDPAAGTEVPHSLTEGVPADEDGSAVTARTSEQSSGAAQVRIEEPPPWRRTLPPFVVSEIMIVLLLFVPRFAYLWLAVFVVCILWFAWVVGLFEFEKW